MIPELLLAKLREQIERTTHLLELVPPGKLDWRPLPEARSIGELLAHLLDCLAGFCATLCAAYPEQLRHFTRLRELPVNHRCGIAEAAQRIREYQAAIEEGFALIPEAGLARPIPTVFVPSGEALFTLLLGNLEHLINHKHELFTDLKLLGVPVASPDLYHYRG